MGILPVVNLEQVIAQSPALIGERVRDQKREGGPAESGQPPGIRDEPVPPPTSGVLPVRAVGAGEGSEEGLEKEEKSEYPPGKDRERRGRVSKSLEKFPDSSGGNRTGHRLDIEA